MRKTLIPLRRAAAALFAGAALLLAFAPYGFSIVQILSLALFFHLVLKAGNVRQAFLTGWLYGAGWMIAAVYWLYISMHQYGGLPAILAAAAVVALGLFMGLLPATATAFAAWIRQRLDASDLITACLLLPAAIALAEWVRGWLFTGFPWLVLGYAHTDNALAGFAPIAGVYGLTLLGAILSGAGLILVNRRAPRRNAVFIVALAIIAGGYGLKFVNWTQPVGTPVKIRLLQGNVPQEMKFSPDQIKKTLLLYENMVTAEAADLIVTPETAVPIYLHMLPKNWFKSLERFAVRHKTTLAIGIPIADSATAYTNSIIVVSPDSKRPLHVDYRYDKEHLVPFGEFIPRGFHWFIRMMKIPLGSFTRGPEVQAPFPVRDQWVMPNICYEDIFGGEIARQIKSAVRENRPEPGILLNLSNIAWFGDSLALPQHLQISRMRAIETQRPMLRSTNTGVTAAIDSKGNVQGQLPNYSTGSLVVETQGMNGLTPYIRFGNLPAVIASIALLLLGGILAHIAATRNPGYRPNPLAGSNDWEER